MRHTMANVVGLRSRGAPPRRQLGMQPGVSALTRSLIITVSIGALALLLAACGGSDPAPRAAGSPPLSPEIAQRDEETGGSHPGERVYAANCQVCHGTQSGQGRIAGAPSHNETGHTWHHPDAHLTDWVLNGKITGAMPGFGDRLSEAEVNAVLSFIKTWWTPEQRETQADVSQRYQEAIDKQQRS